MKILRIEVYNFGKLKNFCLDFNNAITVISEYNGYGKTTIAEFIRAMFYGIERSRLAKIEDNIYKRVRPWNCDGKFGGSLTYENLGKAYKVTRMFGATASADESTLIEVATGVSLSCDNLGERLFNLDESAFIRCFYIPQEAIVVQNNDSFKASLCSVLSSESSQQYTNALEKLRSARRLLKKEKGEGGAIFDATERKKQLVSARDKATSIYAQMDSNDIKIIEIKQQLLEIDNRQKIVSGNIDSLQQNRPTDNLIKQKQSFEERISEINASLYALPTFTDVDRALPVCLDSLCSERRALLEKQKLSLSAPRPLSRISIIMFIISAALAIGGVITAVLNLIAVAITLFILGVLSLFVAIFARRQNGKSENKELDNLIFNNSSNFQQIFDKFGLSYGDDFFDMSAQLKGYYNQYVTLRARLCDSEKYLQDISTSTFDSNAYNALLSESNALSNKRDTLCAELSRYQTQNAEWSKNIESVADLDDQISICNETIKELQDKYIALDLAYVALTNANASLSSNYLPKLITATDKYFQEFTQGAIGKLSCNYDFNIFINQEGKDREMACFSRGTRELAIMCLRLALAEYIYEGNIPFIIIDDAFVNLDESKFLLVIEELKKLSRQTQVIYFTCHARGNKIVTKGGNQ